MLGGYGGGKAQEAIDTSLYGQEAMGQIGQAKGQFREEHPFINLLSETVPQLAFNKLQVGGAIKGLGTGIRAATTPRVLKALMSQKTAEGAAARAAVQSALQHGIGADLLSGWEQIACCCERRCPLAR